MTVGKKISYSYDNNGNTVQDSLKNLQITYNILNLPQTVTQSGTTKATYGWFADGSKYSVQDAQGNGYCYIGSLIYSTTAGAAVLESTDFSGGRIVLSGNTQTIHYHHKDHLGSVRAITDGSGSTIEQNAYYPFGGRHTFGQTYAQTTANRYKFNGKELQTIGSLDLLDYGARMYDTKTARWLVQDPLAEKYYPFSAYNYCVNNPVMFVDPDGKAVETAWDLISLGAGLKSLWSNIRQGNVGAAIADGVGVILDAGAVALPFVPGGASAAIAAVRIANTADNIVEATKVVKSIDNINDTQKLSPIDLPSIFKDLGIKDGEKMTSSNVLELAEKFLGKGYTETSPGSGRFVSSDNSRVFRMGENDITGKHGVGKHVNLEILQPNPNKPGKMIVKENIHIFLKD